MAFWLLVARRAILETLELFGLHKLGRAVVSMVSFAVAVAVLTVLPGGANQVGEEARWMLAIAIAAAVMFLPVLSVKLVTVPASIHREQQAELERLSAGRSAVAIIPVAYYGGAFLRIRNGGEAATFQVIVDGVDGVEFSKNAVAPTFPYYAPWLGTDQAAPKSDDGWRELQERRLLQGASWTVALLTLFPRQNPPPHTLFRLWSTEAWGGSYIAHGANEGEPHITFRISLLSSLASPRQERLVVRIAQNLQMRFTTEADDDQGGEKWQRAQRLIHRLTRFRDEGAAIMKQWYTDMQSIATTGGLNATEAWNAEVRNYLTNEAPAYVAQFENDNLEVAKERPGHGWPRQLHGRMESLGQIIADIRKQI